MLPSALNYHLCFKLNKRIVHLIFDKKCINSLYSKVTCNAFTIPSMISGSISGSSPCILTTTSYFFLSFWRASLHRSVPGTDNSAKFLLICNRNFENSKKITIIDYPLPFRQDSDVIITSAPNPRQQLAIFSSSVATTILGNNWMSININNWKRYSKEGRGRIKV